MELGIFALLGILIGGVITWGTQYYFRREERKWEERNEKKKACIECIEILHEIVEFYDSFPLTSEDEAYFRKINEIIRKSQVKLKVLFENENKKIIEAFEDANRTLKGFVVMETGERPTISKEAREKIKKFESFVCDYFQGS